MLIGQYIWNHLWNTHENLCFLTSMVFFINFLLVNGVFGIEKKMSQRNEIWAHDGNRVVFLITGQPFLCRFDG